MSVRLGENADFESSMNGTGTVHAYGYDLAGRRTAVGGSYARTNVPPAAPTASYNLNNQLTNWNGATLAYDNNGNLTNDGTNTYMWNARNQLVTISGSVNANFQYDAFGRRVSKTINGTTQFLYDGVNPVQEISGTSASANLLTGGVDEYFQRTDSAGARNFLTDALGSTLALADSTGTVQTSYTFEPFGNTSVTGSSTTNSFAYTGRELDGTGLYYYRARYYDPMIGRFVSEDPSGFLGGVNKYAYVGDDPIDFNDLFGLDKNAANNGRNCTVDPASKLQYAEATAQVAAMTGEFFSGLGPGNPTLGPNSATSQVMAQSGPVQEVLNEYYMTGQTSDLYKFGAPGLVSAGGNPVAQFVGSFRWSITPNTGGITLTLTNTTSFRSLTYDEGPQWQRGNHWYPTPMGNTHQTYNITATCR